VMDRWTDNLSFMYAHIYVGFILVSSFNVHHLVYTYFRRVLPKTAQSRSLPITGCVEEI